MALCERTQYGYYTDYGKLAHDAEVLDNISDISGIFVTLNEVNPDALTG